MISILMPIYNGIEFIDESVSTIKYQTYKNWELIIGINGHPENSEVYQKAKEYENDKIKVYDMIGVKGKSNALNKMLDYCSNDWICLLDVDDKWLPKKLENQISYMDNYDVIGTNCKYFGNKDGFSRIPLGNLNNHNFLSVNPIINSSCLIKKQLCYWEGSLNLEDYDLWLRLCKQGKKFYNVESIEVLHRLHNESAFNAKGNYLKVKELKKKYI